MCRRVDPVTPYVVLPHVGRDNFSSAVEVKAKQGGGFHLSDKDSILFDMVGNLMRPHTPWFAVAFGVVLSRTQLQGLRACGCVREYVGVSVRVWTCGHISVYANVCVVVHVVVHVECVCVWV